MTSEPRLLSASPEAPHRAATVRSSPAHQLSVDIHGDHCGDSLVGCALVTNVWRVVRHAGDEGDEGGDGASFRGNEYEI